MAPAPALPPRVPTPPVLAPQKPDDASEKIRGKPQLHSLDASLGCCQPGEPIELGLARLSVFDHVRGLMGPPAPPWRRPELVEQSTQQANHTWDPHWDTFARQELVTKYGHKRDNYTDYTEVKAQQQHIMRT